MELSGVSLDRIRGVGAGISDKENLYSASFFLKCLLKESARDGEVVLWLRALDALQEGSISSIHMAAHNHLILVPLVLTYSSGLCGYQAHTQTYKHIHIHKINF